MRKAKILIVDDEPSAVEAIKRFLEALGPYEVRLESRGEEVFAAARSFRPDLILLDVMLPDMGGPEIADQLRADKDLAGVPIVFMTGILTKGEAKARKGRVGGHPFLAKPVGLDEVQRTVERVLTKPPKN